MACVPVDEVAALVGGRRTLEEELEAERVLGREEQLASVQVGVGVVTLQPPALQPPAVRGGASSTHRYAPGISSIRQTSLFHRQQFASGP